MKTNYCSNCGAKISQKALFCGECGSKIERITGSPEIKSKQCSNCNYISEGDEIYCPDCGTKFIGGGKENESSNQEQPPPIKKETKRVPHSAPEPIKKKKGGFFRTLGKVALWIIAFLIVAMVALYYIGDNLDSTDTAQDFLNEESLQNISEEEMRLPAIKVRQAHTKLSETTEFKIRKTTKEQVFNYDKNTKISIPPDFTTSDQSLAVSIARVDPAVFVEDALPVSIIDLTLNGGEQPAKPVDVAFTYDPGILNPAFTVEEQLEAYRWDEAGGGWVSLPMRFDNDSNTAYALVDHFSPGGLFLKIFEMSEDYVAELKAMKLAKQTIDALGDKIPFIKDVFSNSIYYTPQMNFKIMYSKSAIHADSELNTDKWKNAPTGRTSSNQSDAPPYIQAIGYILEEALKSYTTKHNFKNPVGLVLNHFGVYKKSINVKIDSHFATITKSSSYEKIFETIHIPTDENWHYSVTKINLAHELFHAIQAQSHYYGVSGLVNPFNKWFNEATAEYAAYQMAFAPEVVGTMDKGIGNNYLNFSLDHTGVIAKTDDNYGWTKREYQYVSSIWVKYLVDNGANLEKLITFDASDYKRPIYSLSSYLIENKQGSIGSLYRKFANDMTFSPKGSLYKYPYTTKGGKNDRDISIENSTLILGKKNEVSYNFENLDHLSAHLWAINLEKLQGSSSSKLSPVIVEVKDKTPGLILDIFIVPKDKSRSTSSKPFKTLFKEDSSEIILVKAGDLICVVATQGLSNNGVAEVLVYDASVQLEIDPGELKDAVSNRAYPFEITANNIPKTVEKVKFEWDFGDGKKGSQGFQSGVAVNSETAETKIQHTYDESDKEETFPLNVVLKDDATGMTLATKEVIVTLPMQKPSVLISATHFVGPPGATFDMEALASPKSTYRFVWQVDGMAEAYKQVGEKSGIAPIISKIGQYNVVVKLYSTNNTFLASDKATITVEEDELNTEGIEGIVDIDEGIKESVQKAWVLTETKLDNKADRIEKKNKSYKNVYTYKQNLSNNSLYCKQTYIGGTDTYYNPAKVKGEGLGAQFNWTGPPKFINPGDKITMQLNGSLAEENQSFFGFSFQISAGACIYKKGANDANWCESLSNKEGKTTFSISKKNTSFNENVSMDNIPKGESDEILYIRVGGGIEGARTQYIYEWK